MSKNNEDKAKTGATRAGQGKRSTSSVVASLMDDFIRIPGTNIRIGLDPIHGLFPGLGDMVASLVDFLTIRRGTAVAALRKGRGPHYRPGR